MLQDDETIWQSNPGIEEIEIIFILDTKGRHIAEVELSFVKPAKDIYIFCRKDGDEIWLLAFEMEGNGDLKVGGRMGVRHCDSLKLKLKGFVGHVN